MPMGPIELADMVGLDIGWAVGQELAKPGAVVPKKLKALVDGKRLGKKSREGYYKWEKGKAVKSGVGPGTVDLKALADRLVLPALNEAVACVREKIVADADLCDAGIVFGTGFAPHRGGPINYIRQRGKPELLAILADLRKQHGDRFAADAGWAEI
jgi:3-hydroxyacyl-CoA dehydrogenase/enoyl-CoA hydratase/3-hydroxybutyryl-CoA epimerase